MIEIERKILTVIKELPPVTMTLLYRAGLMSTSHMLTLE